MHRVPAVSESRLASYETPLGTHALCLIGCVTGNSTGTENALVGSRLRWVCTCAPIHFRFLTKYARTGFQTNDRTKVKMICRPGFAQLWTASASVVLKLSTQTAF